ncbi:MAG: polymer-forming cytoskeletal protein [Kiloniellales bacterium]|nr:polymer-forming cytoskeletal protein [Kiloniellales bacterium]
MFVKNGSIDSVSDSDHIPAKEWSKTQTAGPADGDADLGDAVTMATPPSRGTGISTPGATRRPNLGITAPNRGLGGGPAGTEQAEGRTLVVGREIKLAGEITSCDRLMVEGQVEADLSECRDLTIAGSGIFKGRASVENATVSGLFEGELTVLGHLLLKNGGRIQGRLDYNEMEVEKGGKIVGEIVESDGPAKQSSPAKNDSRRETASTDTV